MDNRNMRVVWMVCLLVAVCVASSACKKKAGPETTPEPTTQQDQGVVTPEPTPRPEPKEVTEGFEQQEPETRSLSEQARALNEQGVLKTIYFGYDKSDLTDTARTILRENANWLKANPQWHVVIEGHCDERGTIEYNLALGQRRANSVRDYMVSLGVDASRIRTVSYGEERPVDPGHTEAAWAKNRRGVSQVEEG